MSWWSKKVAPVADKVLGKDLERAGRGILRSQIEGHLGFKLPKSKDFAFDDFHIGMLVNRANLLLDAIEALPPGTLPVKISHLQMELDNALQAFGLRNVKP
jgi:hypothetical protein